MPSGSLSVGGTCTRLSLRPAGAIGWVGMAPVTSLDETGETAGAAGVDGIATDAVPSAALGAELFSDCRPIGVGEVIEGAAGSGMAGLALSSAGGRTEGCGSLELSMAGGGGVPPSSSVIAILKLPSTITTTLAPTSSERIL